MDSIHKEVTGTTLANQIRLESDTHEGSFLLVEGGDDAKLLKKFCDEGACAIVVCLGKENLLEAITILERDQFIGALGIADKDYADYVGYPEYEGVVLFSDHNDLEIMMLLSPALDSLLGEFGLKEKIAAAVENEGMAVSEIVFNAAKFLGTLRLVSQEQFWNLSFEGMSYRFLDNRSMVLKDVRTVKHVLGRTREKHGLSEEYVLECVTERMVVVDAAAALCNGHDCLRVVGRALKHRVGSRGEFEGEKGAGILGAALRLAYELEFFRETNLYRGIKYWEHATGLAVMR